MKDYSLSLAIPCFNEEDNVLFTIPRMFDAFNSQKISLQIVAINNGSTDRTLENLKKLKIEYPNLKIIDVKPNRGYGGAIILGLKNSQGKFIGFTCADEQITAKDILKVYKEIVKQNFDIVKANRVNRYDGRNRKIYSFIFNKLLNVLFRIKIRDINGYPVIMKRNLFDKLNLNFKDWMINTELLVKARLLKFNLGEENVIFYQRRRGKTNVRLKTLLDFVLQILRFSKKYYFSNEFRMHRK